jgi:hypothetical protein
MSYDKIWIKRSEHPEEWLERSSAAKKNLNDEFNSNFDRLYTQGHFVVLVAGKNFLFDELFLFESSASAQNFYDSGFINWESFMGGDNEGCGFQEISLYSGGHLVATKSCEPTMLIEVKHG